MKVRPSTEQEVENLLSKAFETRVHNPAQSIKLAEQAAELSIHNNPGLYAKALTQLGLFYMIRGDFQKSTEISIKALSYFETSHDLKGIADAKYNIGSNHYKTDNFHLGLQYLLDCLQIYRQLDDKNNEARVLKAIGTIYEFFGDQENTIDYYLQCIEVAQKVNDLNQVSNAYNPLSGIYLKQGKIDLAKSIIENSISIKEETKDVRGLAFSLYGRGKVFLSLNRYKEAFEDFQKSLHIHLEMSDKLGEGMVYNKLGLLYKGEKKYQEAEQVLLKAIEVSQSYNIRFILYKAHYSLYLLKREQGLTQQALEYLEKYISLKEAVINTQTYNVLKSYEAIVNIESLEREAKVQKEKAEIIEKKNAELDSFFYRISHDLKGPISSLLGLHNVVQIDIKDKEALHYFGLYHFLIQRMNNIVMGLINLTRMNHVSATKDKIDFSSLVEECIQSYSYIENFKTINFVRDIDEKIVFFSEWAIVNTILQNLIENAIKYCRNDREPYVGIFISKEKSHIRIQVKDNGQGINPEYQAKIFDMFFRANNRTQGTGLGLYILKRAVERLKGEISVESKMNEGSLFTVLLPFHTGLPQAPGNHVI